MTDRTQTPLAGLGLDTAIHLRWVLRDVKGRRTRFMPANPDDLQILAEMGLIEMRELVPTITCEGERASRQAETTAGRVTESNLDRLG